MNGLLALVTLSIIFAIGDLASAKTKAIFSMMFVSSVILMVGFWVGLPSTIFEDSGLLQIGIILIGFLITHMGTLMSFKELKEQWKTAVIALVAVVGIGVFLFLVGSPILGREYAVAAAPPISGGVVAAIIMGDAAKAKGIESIAVFTTLLVVVQGFFGYPVASFMLNKEAKRLVNMFRENKLSLQGKASAEVAVTSTINNAAPKYRIIPELPKELQTNFILFAKLGLVAVIGFKLSGLTNGIIHQYVMCLFVGIIAREIGFLEESIMVKANAFGLGMAALMAVIFSSLAKATPQMVLSLLAPLLISLALGTIGAGLSALAIGKILGYSKEMSIAIGVSALFGFPGTFIISTEVSNAVGQTDEEKKAILDEILPKMLVAGFVTVTISSVILAGVMVNML